MNKIEDFNPRMREQIRKQLYETNCLSSNPKPEQVVCHEPLATDKGETSNPIRVKISYVSYRRRLLDPDNPTAKYFTDALRYEGCIKNDTLDDVEITIRQVKVKTKQEERTEITIL